MQEWENKIKPVLDEEASHRPFNIYEYGTEILSGFDSEKKGKFCVEVLFFSAYIAKRKIRRTCNRNLLHNCKLLYSYFTGIDPANVKTFFWGGRKKREESLQRSSSCLI